MLAWKHTVGESYPVTIMIVVVETRVAGGSNRFILFRLYWPALWSWSLSRAASRPRRLGVVAAGWCGGGRGSHVGARQGSRPPCS